MMNRANTLEVGKTISLLSWWYSPVIEQWGLHEGWTPAVAPVPAVQAIENGTQRKHPDPDWRLPGGTLEEARPGPRKACCH